MNRNPLNQSSCAVVIVTHNSQSVLEQCLHSLNEQTFPPRQIILIDSGSKDVDYLNQAVNLFPISLHLESQNVGFCVANNIGMSEVDPTIKYVLFLNPDAFLTSRFIEQAVAYLEHPLAEKIGALSGLLLGYDLLEQKPSGLIDSTGIFQTWYGGWYDRGQGESCTPFPGNYCRTERVPALCGALMFCRYEALKSVEFAPNEVMDSSFYMYKEDIDLSIRLRLKGWSLLYVPDLIAYHCRGWKQNRAEMSKEFRLMSAKNEMTIYARLRSPYYIHSALKYYLVKELDF